MSLSCCSSLFLSLPLLLFLLFLLSLEFLFVLFSPLVLLDHGVSVETRLTSHAEIQKIVKVVIVLDLCHQVKLNLSKELRDESAVHWKLARLAQSTFIDHNLECIPLEQIEEIFSSFSWHYLLLCPYLLTLGGPLLQVASLGFVHSALASCFHALRLKKLCLFDLKEELFVLWKLSIFMVFYGLNLSELNCFSHKDLQNGFSFQFKVKKVGVFIVNLNCLDLSFGVRYENGWRL